ncbi:MAG: carboxypeptidase-like regulatory domain-containing protein [Cytophagales bacterium]|nr:carboxypeptidase-like regulatory domain-containing protein [Cytophagales bacterium]
MKTHSFLFVFALLILSTQSKAQQQQLYTVKHENRSIPYILENLQALSDFRFFYKRSELDTLYASVSATNRTIPQILDLLFLNRKIYYAIDTDKNVIVTRSIAINTEVVFAQGTDKSQENLSAPAQPRLSANAVEGRGNRILEIGDKNKYIPGRPVQLSGVIRNTDRHPIQAASVQVEALNVGVASDSLGHYKILLPSGKHNLIIRFSGMENFVKTIMLYGSGELDIQLSESVKNLEEVVIQAEATSNVKSLNLGVAQISPSFVKYIPTAFGEADVLRSILTLPGVKSIGEVSTGFNVRGGAADQNLILFNDATIYNPAHFFGFFSAFNSEVVSGIELFKSSMPAKYGGRLSSVLQVSTKTGNPKNLTGSAGIGPITARFNLEGPINKKTTFVLGGRTTYSNWLFKLLPEEFEKSKAAFYDLTTIVSHQLSDASSITLTGYLSHDESNLNTDTTFRYDNKNISIKYQHDFKNGLYMAVALGQDHYGYDNHFTKRAAEAYKLSFVNNQSFAKIDFTFLPQSRHKLSFGLNLMNYKISPGQLEKGGPASTIVEVDIPQEQGLETSLYFSDEITLTDRLSIEAGVRLTQFNYLGPQEVRYYDPSAPRNDGNATEIRTYKNNETINTFRGIDPRISTRYELANNLSLKLGYTSTRQFIHMISNTVSISPTDIWKLSDPNIAPQLSHQLSVGLYKDLSQKRFEISLEAYGKRIRNYLDYKSGAQLLANAHIETEVFKTSGKAYGIEGMIRKNSGKLTGWLGYTFSRTLIKTDDIQAGEKINKGNYYPANYDKPHDFTLVANEKFTRRFSTSMSMSYSTGRPITIPIGVFYYGNSQKTLYSDRNGYRLPDYFRMDLSINIEGNHKVNQRLHNYWTIGAYNLTGRKNPYSIYFTSENGLIKGYKLSIFGSVIPFVNYTIKF